MKTSNEMDVPRLNPFEQWMVKSNLETAKTKGSAWVICTLRQNGYPKIAQAVENALKRQPVNAVVIKQTNDCVGQLICAWYVRHNGTLTGQFQTESDAITFAMDKLVADCGRTGRPLDASELHDLVKFEQNTAYDTQTHNLNPTTPQ